MANDDGKAAVGRRSSRLRKVLVAGGVALAAGCAGMHKDSKSSTGSSSSDSGAASNGNTQPDSKGGGASGW
jgi:hypothetical protein